MGCINTEPINNYTVDTRNQVLQLRKTLVKSRNNLLKTQYNGMETPIQRTGDTTTRIIDYDKEVDYNKYKRLYENELLRNDILSREIEILKVSTDRLKKAEDEYKITLQAMKQTELEYKEALEKLSAPVRLSPKLIRDDYDYSRDIFSCLNNIRQSPEIMIDMIESLLSVVTIDDDVAYLDLTKHSQFSSLGGNYELKRGMKGLKELKDLIENTKLDQCSENIIWSECAFAECQVELEDLNHLEIDYSDDDDEEVPITYSSRVIAKLEGCFLPMAAIVLLLAEEQPSIRNSLLYDTFEIGACSYIKNDEEFPKGMVIVILSIRKNIEARLLEYPIIEVGDELDLSHPVFSHLEYKSLIIDGDFEIENGILKACFTLNDGSKIIERIVLP